MTYRYAVTGQDDAVLISVTRPLEAPLATREGLDPRRMPAVEGTVVLMVPPETGPGKDQGACTPLGHEGG